MSKKKFGLIFSGFVALLICMILLPSFLFKLSDYALINRVKIEELDLSQSQNSDLKTLSTEERLELMSNKNAFVENDGAFDETQKKQLFNDACEELSKLQDLGACPKFDMSNFKMVKFSATAYIDLFNAENYVKTIYIAAQNNNDNFNVIMDLETGKIYHYAINGYNKLSEDDVMGIMKCFADYLGMDFDISANKNPYDVADAYTMQSSSGIGYHIIYAPDFISFELM